MNNSLAERVVRDNKLRILTLAYDNFGAKTASVELSDILTLILKKIQLTGQYKGEAIPPHILQGIMGIEKLNYINGMLLPEIYKSNKEVLIEDTIRELEEKIYSVKPEYENYIDNLIGPLTDATPVLDAEIVSE
jgi:hypothetical protein